MGTDNNANCKQQASAPATGSDKSSKHSNQTSQQEVLQSQMPQPPLPGMEPKPRPAPEIPEKGSVTNLRSSLNYLSTHPDATRPSTLPCCCGFPVRIDGDDWYTEIYDGTVRCVQCSFCARCGTDGVLNCRQQVSIGGHVLCYNCVKHFGDKKFNDQQIPMPPVICHPRNKGNKRSGSVAKKRRAKIQSPEQSEAHNVGLSNSNQSNWWQSSRSPECRTILRYRDYPRPVSYILELDPKLNQIGFYSATRPEFDRMACPSCKIPATGKDAYVVPSISLVYHRKCFYCLGCKCHLSTGVKTAGVHFVFCSCTPPTQWCTRLACTRQRIEHHTSYKCYLEPVHPGGREQNDTRILFVDNLMDKGDKKTKKKTADNANPDDQTADAKLNETTATSASNMVSGLKNRDRQQYLKLTRARKLPAKDGRLLLPSPSSGTPAPSVSSSLSSLPQFSNAVAAKQPNVFRPGQQGRRK